MYIKLLYLLFAINTWCFGQLPGEGSTEAIGSSGFTILLKNRESFQDDPSVLSQNRSIGGSFQHIIRAKFQELSSNRINLLYKNLGISIGRQAEHPLGIWNGLVAAGLPLSNRVQSGVYVGVSGFQSPEQPWTFFQYMGCVSIRFQASEQISVAARWEHQQFMNSNVLSRPAIGLEFRPDKHWSIISGIDWVSAQTELNYYLKIGYKYSQKWTCSAAMAANPFQISLLGNLPLKRLNLSFGWNYGLPIGAIASQSLSYFSNSNVEPTY